MFLLALSIISVILCYKFGDWRNWKVYYSTIIFFILSSVVCILLTYNHPLWFYESRILNKTFSDLFISITVYPSTVMIFIPNFPRKRIKAFTHITYYVVIYTIVEYIALKLNYFSYHNGWNIVYSLIFNYIMFPLLFLHYKKPLYAWIIALCAPHILFYLLDIPYDVIR